MTEAVTRPAPGTPCWASLRVHDLAAGQKFYSELFGWEFREGPRQTGPFVRAHFGDLVVAGLGEARHEPSGLGAWLPYLATDDADATCARIRESGGTVAVGPLDSGEDGRLAIASDPSGAAFGIWQAGLHSGTEPDGRPGTAVWDELVTRSAHAVRPFYRAVFGFDTERVEAASGNEYLALKLDGRLVGGMRGVGDELPSDRGPYWTTYFSVTDADDAARRVVELGGQILRDPRNSPYGRLAHVADSEGAAFAVVQLTDPSDAVTRPLRR
ncbi:VOC family protein [Streptomyces sp. 549]|uniref:VOC family protein n=1 Tax=Streptomyces sp. 549 TaxID=3049076 RepID=UPI0024C2F105|nr:VOC family protein [Streptomyces sp. 549]MDK1475936.1 VOC family protein [Streptomyces sp. 549]